MADATPTEIAAAIVQVDDARPAADPFKLPPFLRGQVVQRLADYNARLNTLTLAQGDRVGASVAVRGAYDALNTLLHDAYNFLFGLPSYVISKTDRRTLLITYGWEKGLLGEFNDARVLKLSGLALSISPQISNTAHRLPIELTDLIAAQIAIVESNQPLAIGGSKEVATGAKNHALELLEVINSRARFYYCAASDETQYTKELSKIGFQPRRDYGSLQPGAAPSPPPPGSPPNP